MAITVTPKYKPFTYDELIKPLEGYWEDYEKHEEAVSALLTDVATVKSIVDALPESQKEEKEKFYNYYNKLESESDALRQSGYNQERAKSMTELKKLYAIEIPRISLAEQARRAALAEYMKLRNSGKYIMDESNSPMVHTYVDYLDGNIPSYYMGMDKDELWQKAGIAAKNLSSRIFQDLKTDVVTRGGHRFLRTIQQQGVNPSTMEELFIQYPQFTEELEELKIRLGISKLPEEVQMKAVQVLKESMFNNLIYDKKENLTALPRAVGGGRPQQDPNAIALIGKDQYGNLIVQRGGRQYTVDPLAPVTNDGQLNIVSGEARKELTPVIAENVQTKPIGFDNYYNKNVLDPENAREMDENSLNTNEEVVKLYMNTATKDPSVIYPRNLTQVMNPANYSTLLAKSKENYNEETGGNMATYYNANNVVFFNTGGGYRETNQIDTDTRRGEFLGDNHIRGMRIQDFITTMEDSAYKADEKLKGYEKVYINSTPTVQGTIMRHILSSGKYTEEDLRVNAKTIYAAYEKTK